jgi:transglutaminase-like putative cysteine protease
MITDRVTYEQLLGISGCLALALLAHITTLPLWVPGIVVACGIIRLGLARGGRGTPPGPLLVTVAVLVVPLLLVRFHTFNGLVAGTALLSVTAGLKLLETKTRRDIYIITLIIYFVSLAALLEGDSFWLLTYLIGVCWLTTATLLRLTSSGPAPGWRPSLRYGGRVLLQALPLALVFWLLFPRFAGPLWHIPSDSQTAASGLSDTMSPGDISQLALSDEVAFRVRFESATPPNRERYWRGPVLDLFDGHTWSRSASLQNGAPALKPLGPSYKYTVMMEPHRHRWIFMLDWPSSWNLPHSELSSDYTLMQAEPLSRPVDVVGASYTQVQSTESLSDRTRSRDLRLPRERNPRTAQLARELRSAHPDDMELLQAVLAMFTRQPFFYTLNPPKLSDDSVDEFLFNTKRGFCGHYASAFAALARAAGIPARVVTGYQGGTLNPYGDYWILRQSDAHAWTEVWIEGRGWVRIDPTAAIAPERVERGLADAASADESLASPWQRRTLWFSGWRLRFDAVKEIWRERILDFDQDSQRRLLEFLKIPEPDGQKLVMVLAAAMSLVLAWLTWQVRRELAPRSKDETARAYARLCAKLAAAGMPRLPHEGAEAFAQRVARLRPDLADIVGNLCRQYSFLRYAAPTTSVTLGQFQAAVRAFSARQGG